MFGLFKNIKEFSMFVKEEIERMYLIWLGMKKVMFYFEEENYNKVLSKVRRYSL